MDNSEEEQMQLQQEIVRLENLAKQYMDKEAINRYGNLKSAHPQLALQLIVIIAQMVQNGYIKEKLNDESIKEFLKKIQKPKKEFKIIKK